MPPDRVSPALLRLLHVEVGVGVLAVRGREFGPARCERAKKSACVAGKDELMVKRTEREKSYDEKK